MISEIILKKVAVRTKLHQGKLTAKSTKEAKLSQTPAPADLAPIDWQHALRRQFGREPAFGLENIGAERFFSEFHGSNRQSKNVYRVAIHGERPGDNFCACADFSPNELGSCKHIEVVLAALEIKSGAKAASCPALRGVYNRLALRHP